MTSRAFRERLGRRARSFGITVEPGIGDALETYLRLLTRWNAKVNLTGLPLDEPTDETFDRLLIEPLAAARYVDEAWTPWIDIGSGGGSPAIPLKLAKPGLELTLIESKARKAAFLREVIRELGLDATSVETVRFEDFAARPSTRGAARLVTIRAVRVDSKLIKSVASALRAGGRLLAFRESPLVERLDGFATPSSTALHQKVRPTYLVSYERS